MAVIQRRDLITPLRVQPEYFSDVLADFTPDRKGDVSRVTNEESIKVSIKNLLLTNRGDRLFNNTLGSDIRSMLFELHGTATEQVLKDLIKTTIDNYEPRARINNIDISFDEDQQWMAVTIVFSIINKQEPITLDLILNRIR
jgi:phage baseplate assembly protein W